MSKSKTGGAERVAKQSPSGKPKSKVDWSAVAKKRLESLKNREFHCPVHKAEKFVGLSAWASHRRWCRAGAKTVKKTAARQVPKAIGKRKYVRKVSNVAVKKTRKYTRKPVLASIPFDLHQSTVLLKNSKRVVSIASFVHGDNFDGLADRLKKLIGSGFTE